MSLSGKAGKVSYLHPDCHNTMNATTAGPQGEEIEGNPPAGAICVWCGKPIISVEETPLIDRNYDVILPSGCQGRVNVFDMNLAMACGGERYIQLEDTSWIQAKRLKVIPKSKG
jgi:hypothetical protein